MSAEGGAGRVMEGLKERERDTQGRGGRSERAIQGTCPLSPSELRGGGGAHALRETLSLTYTHAHTHMH